MYKVVTPFLTFFTKEYKIQEHIDRLEKLDLKYIIYKREDKKWVEYRRFK